MSPSNIFLEVTLEPGDSGVLYDGQAYQLPTGQPAVVVHPNGVRWGFSNAQDHLHIPLVDLPRPEFVRQIGHALLFAGQNGKGPHDATIYEGLDDVDLEASVWFRSQNLLFSRLLTSSDFKIIPRNVVLAVATAADLGVRITCGDRQGLAVRPEAVRLYKYLPPALTRYERL
jgi:hypothetical protein